MGREIGEIPAVVQRVLDAPDQLTSAAAVISHADPRWIMIAGRGTSDHAAVYAQYLIETHLALPTGLVKPSVTTVYRTELDWRGGLVLAISQSGQSPDVVAVVEAARRSGALTLAITNEPASPLAAAADIALEIHAGRELAVPATKTYVAELAVVAALANAIRPTSTLGEGLAALPDALRDTIVRTRDWLSGAGALAVDAFVAADRALLVSRGFNLATALELALKLKETCGLFAEAYSTADFMHGPLVLARADVPTLAIRPDGPMGADVDATVAAVAARGGRLTVFGGPETAPAAEVLALPHALPEALTPLLFVVPGQLLVEATAAGRGLNPDAPAGLGKVTLTR
jgi:glucosamine--fructose-6-phosphate aminotransferase (isomerizing)